MLGSRRGDILWFEFDGKLSCMQSCFAQRAKKLIFYHVFCYLFTTKQMKNKIGSADKNLIEGKLSVIVTYNCVIIQLHLM